jgi:hypothetical protein
MSWNAHIKHPLVPLRLSCPCQVRIEYSRYARSAYMLIYSSAMHMQGGNSGSQHTSSLRKHNTLSKLESFLRQLATVTTCEQLTRAVQLTELAISTTPLSELPGEVASTQTVLPVSSAPLDPSFLQNQCQVLARCCQRADTSSDQAVFNQLIAYMELAMWQCQ